MIAEDWPVVLFKNKSYICNMKVSVPHIVQYQGSKRKLAPQILQYIPKKFNRLIEPFSGMAAISIATAYQQRTKEFIINDINPDIISVLQSATESPNTLIDAYTEVWQEQFTFNGGSEAHYYKVRDDFNNGERKASYMLYLLARCVKGSVRYNAEGGFNQSPDKRRNGTSPQTMRNNIYGISLLLNGKTRFYSKDFREILEMAKTGDIIYMDPPYQGVSNVRDHRYIAGLSYEEFVLAIEELRKKNIDFLISYDGSLGDKTYGADLPSEFNLIKINLNAGLSTQALYLGKKIETIETLYVTPNLLKNIRLNEEVCYQSELIFV